MEQGNNDEQTRIETLETYESVVDASTTLVLTTNSDFYGLLNGIA